jgi:transposase-like protein
MKPRRQFTPEQKMIILRELLEEKVPISQLAEKYQIHTNDIYNWKKKLFESASDIFSNSKQKNNKTESEEKIQALEEKLKKRDEAISYLLQDNIELKKSIDGES